MEVLEMAGCCRFWVWSAWRLGGVLAWVAREVQAGRPFISAPPKASQPPRPLTRLQLSNNFHHISSPLRSIPRTPHLLRLFHTATMVDENKDLLDDLDREAHEYVKDAEIARILNAFKLDAYAILDLQPGVTETDIKKTFRSKSLLIHPDKTKNPQAPDAFDRLKKAQAELSDEKKRERLDEAIADARMLLIRERKWTVDTPELKEEAFKRDWREKSKEVLIENELRRRKQLKVQMAEEGREKMKAEQEVEERKRKRESEQAWESTRDKRIDSWREFQKGGSKKKKKKMAPLG